MRFKCIEDCKMYLCNATLLQLDLHIVPVILKLEPSDRLVLWLRRSLHTAGQVTAWCVSHSHKPKHSHTASYLIWPCVWYIEQQIKGSLLVLYKLFVVLVVPGIVLFEPLEMFLCIKRVVLLVREHQAALCSNGSFSHLIAQTRE